MAGNHFPSLPDHPVAVYHIGCDRRQRLALARRDNVAQSHAPNTMSNAEAAADDPPRMAASPAAPSPSAPVSPPPTSSSFAAAAPHKPAGPSAAQALKLRDANAKYKNLLKLAKERIQAQEDDLERLRSEGRRAKEDLASEKIHNAELAARAAAAASAAPSGHRSGRPDAFGGEEENCSVVRIYQRVKIEMDDDLDNGAELDPITGEPVGGGGGGNEGASSDADGNVIWALIEYESSPSDDAPESHRRRYAEWRRFGSESDFADHVRRDAGEPVSIPPYSLGPEQSRMVKEEAKRSVERATEDFRRFRVRAEVARKQADATVRALHSSNVATTRRRIEGQDVEATLERAREDQAQLSQLRTDMAEQEVKWKEAYDTLMAENSALKSSGAEALLAAQWRHRYEQCLGEKENAEARLDVEKQKVGALSDNMKRSDAGKYENKYRDLKESFRLYRKKAKEIFEAQQRGSGGLESGLLNLTDRAAEDAKLTYLRNLMVNYLSSDSAVREHMEGAIGTVLKFSNDDIVKIEKRKESDGTWFS